ncbi:PBECR2 nuclease fold domain-containing protein, partial [Helicobacter trogontum]|uniref:putative barnase/colicin E5 family endoribonuclease n=2 Tax=Helicobacter trogontum TaxID=50960 RepID=UPI0013873816
MGYLFTPQQQEKDKDFISSTLEELKTTNLLKQAQESVNNANLNAQNTNIPQNTISQHTANNAQIPQDKQTQQNIGNINIGSNVSSTQSQNMLPQESITKPQTNTTPTQAYTTTQNNTHANAFDKEIALSSNKDFKPQSQTTQQAQIPQTPFKSKKSTLQREREATKYDTHFNQSAYTRNTTAFLGEPHEFKNYKLAMAAKSNLLHNIDDDANVDDEVFKRFRLIDRAVAALETAKKTYGKDSKEYKNVLEQYMQYGILKDNDITDYESLARFYERGGNVGFKIKFKESKPQKTETKEEAKNEEADTTNKQRDIKEFVTALKDFSTKKQEREQKDKGYLEQVSDWFNNTYKFDNKNNLEEQIKNGFSPIEGFNILEAGGLEKVLGEYKKNLEGITTIDGRPLNAHSHFASYINGQRDIAKGALDTLTFGLTSLLPEGQYQHVEEFFKYMDMAISVSEGASKAFNEFRDIYADMLNEDSPSKQAQLKEKAYKKLKEAKEKYESSPAKVYADSNLDRIAETIKHEHDYGRIFNFLRDKNIQKEVKQAFLSDFATILKKDEKYKDLDSLAFTKDNTLIAIMNEKEGQKAYAINPTLMSSILYSLYAAKGEVIGGIAGAAYGAMQGASKVKIGGAAGKATGALTGGILGSMIGTSIGALTDSAINKIVTGYANSDLGVKKALEAASLDLIGNAAIMGMAKGVAKAQDVFSKFDIQQAAKNIGNKSALFLHGNVNSVTNFLAKNALDSNEREAIMQTAQKQFLNGRSLAEYKSDTSIPKLERLKAAWQYEKYINKESMAKGKEKLEALSKDFESFQTTSMESNRPIMDILQDMFEGKATRIEREKFLRFVAQNEALHSALSSVISKNPTLAQNFGKFIDKRANNVAKSIESEALTQRMFKDMDSDYAKGLKERYGRVEFDIVRSLDHLDFSDTAKNIQDTLINLKQSIPHVTNAGQTISAMLEKLQARSNTQGDIALKIDDLLDIRKYYNDILRSKDFKNASYKHLQAINKEIDSAIESSLKDLENKSGINTTKLLNNYKDINKEYADYARFKESEFYKDVVKTKKKEKDLSNENFNKAILKQAQRSEGFNNKVFNKIANNTDKNLQAQVIKELIQKNITNGNGQLKAIKWQELIEDLEKIEHSITDSGLKSLIANFKQAQKLYHADNEFLQAVQRSIGSKPANVLISSASGLFGRTLLLFYNFVHKSMSRFAGALSENLAHQSLEHQLALALRYARDTKDFIHVSIDSISKNMPKEDKETGRILRELSYWKDQFEKDHIASFYTIKEAQQTQYAINAHQAQLIEYKAVINHAMQKTEQDMQGLHKGVVDSIKGVAQQQIIPLQQFGENYAEFQGKGALAIEHLLQVKQGQVAGAFHKDGLGDIDLVWGEVQGSGKDAKGFGLVKILEKHIDEFKDFIGDTKETKLINGLNEIIEKGKVLSKNGVNTIILSKNNKEYRVGLSKGFNGKGENKWVITAYEYNPQIKRGSAETSYHDTFTDKAPLSNSKEDTTTQKQTNQDMEREIPQNLQEAWLKEFNLKSITEDFIPQFNDEIRQALDKAGIRQDFHLKLGSLVKLDNKQREAFLPYIKPTIEHPNLILDNGKGILFIKEFVDSDKNRYFMSVAKDFNNEWIFSSHTRRELNNINNELQKSKVIYNNGFKGGEVAGASDILESGGTTTKPSDLQITYPANHSSGKNPNPNATTIKQTKQDMEREIPYNTQVEFDRQGMAEFQRRIENGEIQLEKATQRHLDNIYKQYEMLQERARELEESLKSLKVLDEESILKTNSTIISQTQRALNAVQDNISFTKEAIKDIENELGANSNKALMPYNVIQHAGPKIQGLGNNLLTQATTKTNIVSTQSKPSFIANLIKPQNNTTQVLIPYNTNKEANNALISYNRAQDPKLLARNEAKLLEYKQTLNTLQKLEKSFKDFMSLPFSIIVDSKGNALPLTSQAIKNFIFHNLYKEYMSVIKALDKPTLALDFKPLSHEIKALPYKANANLKAHLNDINAKTNDFLDSVQEFKKSTQEIKLLPYHKHTENKALDQFGNVMGKPFQTDSILVENMKKNTWHEDERYNVFNPKYHSYKMIDNKEVIKIPDFILSESGKTRKRLVEQESKQIELIEQINAGQTDKFDEFMVNEKKVLEFFAEEFGFKDSGIAQRCLGMADMLQNNNLKEKYLEEVMKTSYQTRHYKESTNKDILKAYQKVYDINRANHANTELQDISFTDKRGNEKILSKETQEQWLKTFGLENLEQSYIPKHSQEIQQALGGKEIKLTKGSLLKLVSKERERYIPQVKETLDNPDYILKDIDEMIILAKKIDDKQYFTSINLETDDFLISISNAPKKENILKNKVEKGAKIIYQSPNSESIFYTPELLQASQSLANKIDSSNSSIKNTNELTQQAKEQGLSQVQSNTNAQQLTLHDIQERLTARK